MENTTIRFSKLHNLVDCFSGEQQEIVEAVAIGAEALVAEFENRFENQVIGAKHQESFGKIITFLMSRASKKTKLFPMMDASNIFDKDNVAKNVEIINKAYSNTRNYVSVGSVFFQCELKEFIETILKNKYIANVTFKDGSSKQLQYWFNFNDILIDKEKCLNRLAEVYGVKQPLVYSPYSRRLASIFLDCNDINSEVTNIDFQWGKNKLFDKMKFGMNLFWNVEIKREDKDYVGEPQKKIIGDNVFFEYRHNGIDENMFVLYETSRDVMQKALRSQEEITILLREKVDEKNLPSIYAFYKVDADLHEENLFGYEYDSSIAVDRIRSLSDAELAARSFSGNGGIRFEKILNEITDEDNITYAANDNNRFFIYSQDIFFQPSGTLYLIFRKEKDVSFADDYVNFGSVTFFVG